MGHITLEYTIDDKLISINEIIREIEYGNTFALYNDREDIITTKNSNLKWIELISQKDHVIINVDDSFFDRDIFFEKFLTIFVFNIIDFGNVKLNKIDISNSIFRTYIKPVIKISRIKSNYYKGSIFKPYYHLSINDKLKQADLYINNGLNILKNDECYLPSKNDLVAEIKILNDFMQNEAIFIPNITSFVHDHTFIESLIELGVDIFLIDFLITGFSSVYRLKEKFPQIKIWGHRIGYSAIERNISMQAIGILSLISGIDFLHIGTPQKNTIDEKYSLYKDFISLKPGFLPVFTKTTPEVLDSILPIFDTNCIYLGCGYFRDNKNMIDWKKVKQWSKCFYE